MTLAGFWRAAEAGLDQWAANEPASATTLQWRERRRLRLFRVDAARLDASWPPPMPELPPVSCTDAAIGRLYVLEGSTLGGQIINRSLAARTPDDPLSTVALRGLAPYGEQTGSMWAAYRRAVSLLAVDTEAVVGSAVETFALLETWCRAPLAGHR